MTPVFGHGRLRLYLLKLLEESPRHGYEIIQQLRERFAGLYSPSAGTVYPRLARLETEGLIRHESDGGRKVYQITDAGRAELAARADELAELETEIRASARDLAEGIRQEVRETAKAVQQELADQARRARSGEQAAAKGVPGWAGTPPWPQPPQPPQPPYPPQPSQPPYVDAPPPVPGLPGFPPGFPFAPPPGSDEWGGEQWRDWKRQQREHQREWRQQQREQHQEWKQRQRDWQRDWKEQWARQWKEQWQQQQQDWGDWGEQMGSSWRGMFGNWSGGGNDWSQLGELFGYLRREGGPLADALRRHGPLSEQETASARQILDRALADLRELLDGPRDAPPEQ